MIRNRIRVSQRQATVGVMTKNTSLQLWCMYLSGSAYLLMRTESVTDYCTLRSLAEAVCLPARLLLYLPRINESCATNSTCFCRFSSVHLSFTLT